MRIEVVQMFFERFIFRLSMGFIQELFKSRQEVCRVGNITCIQIENLGPIINESPGLSA